MHSPGDDDPDSDEIDASRARLYQTFDQSNTLNLKTIAQTRSSFNITQRDDGAISIEPLPYKLQDGQGVHLICAAVPMNIAQYCYDLGKALESKLPKARPNDHRPTSDLICRKEVELWEEIAAEVDPFELKLTKVCIPSSGAVLALYSGAGAKCDNRDRKRARETFPSAPIDQTRIIVHTTIARFIEEVPMDVARELVAQCSENLENQPMSCRIDRLEYVEETHELSNRGKRTTIRL